MHKYRVIGATAIFLAGGCSLSFDVGPSSDAGPPDVAPPHDSGVPGPPDVGTDAASSDTGTPGPPAAPQYVDRATASPSDTTTVVVSRPSGAQAGDLLLVSVFANNESNTITPDPAAGWTVIDRLPKTQCQSVALWAYHVMSASEPASYTFTLAQAPNRSAIAVVAYRGIDAITPLGADRKRLDVGGNEPYGPISVTTDQPNALVVMMPVNDLGGTTPNWSAPAGTTERADSGRLSFFDEVRPNAGPSDPRTAATSSTEVCGAVAMVSVRPARR